MKSLTTLRTRWLWIASAAVMLALAGCADSGTEPAPVMDEAPALELKNYTMSLVGAATDYADAHGADAAIEYYNDPARADGPWYVFIIEDRDGVLYTVAHPTRPEFVGTTRDRIDPSGFDYGAAFAAVTEESGGDWVTYVFGNPETGADALKNTWLVRRGNLLFGAGWYQ